MHRWFVLGLLASCSSSSDRIALRDLTLVSTATLSGNGVAYRVVVDGDTAFVSDESGFQAFHLDETAGATHLASYVFEPQSSQPGEPLALKDHLLAVSHGARISLVDVSDPANPVTRSTIIAGTQGTGLALAFDDHYLYWGGLNVQRADITDPAHPGTPAVVYGDSVAFLLAADGVLYASTVNGALIILDRPNDAIEHPAAPTLGQVAIEAAGDLIRVGDYLYGSTGRPGFFWVVDVHDKTAPSVAVATPAATQIGAQLVRYGDQLLVPSLADLTFDYDISDPGAPTQVDARLAARTYDDQENWGSAGWHRDLLLGNQRGFLFLAPTLEE